MSKQDNPSQDPKRLLESIDGEPEDGVRAENGARVLGRQVALADVAAGRAGREGHVDPVVHH